MGSGSIDVDTHAVVDDGRFVVNEFCGNEDDDNDNDDDWMKDSPAVIKIPLSTHQQHMHTQRRPINQSDIIVVINVA
jgi:hypothetical protein